MSINKNDNNGFSMIELLVVIVILVIIAVFLVPRLFSTTSDAQIAITNSIAKALSSANAENFAVRIENSKNGLPVTNCTSVAKLLQESLPGSYKIKSKKVGNYTTISCIVTGPQSTSGSFLATGIS